MRMIPTIRRLLPRGIGLGIATTLAWLLLSGIYVQQQHQVPSITEFKASLANLTTCPGGDIRLVNDCLDAAYAHRLAAWRSDMGTAVVLPPMLGWIIALLHSLASGFGLIRRRQRA